MSQSTTIIRKDASVCLSSEHAREVLDALQWVVDDWDNMDAADKLTHQGYRNTYYSIKNQLDEIPIYPEPEGCPSY